MYKEGPESTVIILLCFMGQHIQGRIPSLHRIFATLFSSWPVMRFSLRAVALLAALVVPKAAFGAPSPLLSHIEERGSGTSLNPRQLSIGDPGPLGCNTALTRACWNLAFNINTDYEVFTPVTGVTRSVSIIPVLFCSTLDPRLYKMLT